LGFVSGPFVLVSWWLFIFVGVGGLLDGMVIGGAFFFGGGRILEVMSDWFGLAGTRRRALYVSESMEFSWSADRTGSRQV
jgi:hypothetical protein